MKATDYDTNSSNLIYTAQYRESEVSDFVGNPLIEALPPIATKADWMKRLEHLPPFDPSERDEPAHVRSYYILRLQRFFQPLPMHLDLGTRIDQVLRQGYVGRNPDTAERGEVLQRLYEDVQQGTATNAVFCDTQPIASFSLVGASGVGKSTTTERILSTFPQVIYHPKLALHQVVWLKLDCPHDGDIKNLGLDMLVELDRALNTDFRKQYGARIDQEALLGHVKHLMATYSVGIIVIDEIQNLSVKRTDSRDEMMNYFQTLCNTFKLPIMLMGTIKAMKLLQPDLRQARRNAALGAFTWERLRNDKAWELMLGSLWEYQWLEEPIELTESMANMLYEETQGIVAVLSNAFILAQLRALRNKQKKLSEDLFKWVIKKDMAPIQPMIKALQSGDPRRIARYEDIELIDFDSLVEREQQAILLGGLKGSVKAKQPVTSDEAKAITVLEVGGFNRDLAAAAVSRAMEKGIKGCKALTRHAYEDLIQSDDKNSIEPDPDDLRNHAGEHAVSSIREGNFTKGVPEDVE